MVMTTLSVSVQDASVSSATLESKAQATRGWLKSCTRPAALIAISAKARLECAMEAELACLTPTVMIRVPLALMEATAVATVAPCMPDQATVVSLVVPVVTVMLDALSAIPEGTIWT